MQRHEPETGRVIAFGILVYALIVGAIALAYRLLNAAFTAIF